MKGKIVLKVEPSMNPKDIYCTTYQMRDVYAQISTAMIGSLDVMSLLMHQKAAMLAKPGDKVLDVCCGRALTLPLLRRHQPKIISYTGVDISSQNFAPALRKSAGMNIEGRLSTNDPLPGEPFYPFEVRFINEDAAAMYNPLLDARLTPFDYIIYMASIEHMQKEAGLKSLVECYRLLRSGGRFLLTSPNTTDKEDQYTTQYAAHLYEWGANELQQACEQIGFRLIQKVGLLAKATGYEDALNDEYPDLVPVFEEFRKWLPSAWLYAIFPTITPEIADEVAFIFTKT